MSWEDVKLQSSVEFKRATLVRHLPAEDDFSQPEGSSAVGGVPVVVRGTQVLWRCDPPWESYNEDEGTHTFVVTSSTVVMGVPETYVFPADESGAVVSYGELPGSMKGTLDHIAPLTDQGYTALTQDDQRIAELAFSRTAPPQLPDGTED